MKAFIQSLLLAGLLSAAQALQAAPGDYVGLWEGIDADDGSSITLSIWSLPGYLERTTC